MSPRIITRSLTLALTALIGAPAYAADVVVQPISGSGFAVKDSTGTQLRLRVDENGNIVMPVLVNGAQQNLPVCVGSGGQIGPCVPGSSGSSFTLPYAGATSSAAAAFAVTSSGGDALNGFTNQAGNSGVYGNNTGGGKGVFGVSTSGNGIEGGSTTGSGVKGATKGASGQSGVAGVWGDSHDVNGVWGSSVFADGVHGQSGTFSGVFGESTQGAGVWGEGKANDGIHGHTSNAAGTTSGVAGFGDGSNNGTFGISTNGNGVAGYSTTGTGVFGHSNSGFGMATDGHAKQVPGKFGWVKAIAIVHQGSPGVGSCYNSQASGAQVNTPPCGFTFSNPQSGRIEIDFGFDVSGSFVLATGSATTNGPAQVVSGFCGPSDGSGVCVFEPIGSHELLFSVYDKSGNLTSNDNGITVVVF